MEYARQRQQRTSQLHPFPTTQSDPLPALTTKGLKHSASSHSKSPSRLRKQCHATPSSGRRAQTAPSSPIASYVSLRSAATSIELNLGREATTPTSTLQNHLDILIKRLPRLLALSSTLSSRLEHDPSPYNVAEAFLDLQSELNTEIVGWASEVGQLIAHGVGGALGAMVPQERECVRGYRKGGTWSDPDDRLTFSDVVSEGTTSE